MPGGEPGEDALERQVELFHLHSHVAHDLLQEIGTEPHDLSVLHVLEGLERRLRGDDDLA